MTRVRCSRRPGLLVNVGVVLLVGQDVGLLLVSRHPADDVIGDVTDGDAFRADLDGGRGVVVLGVDELLHVAGAGGCRGAGSARGQVRSEPEVRSARAVTRRHSAARRTTDLTGHRAPVCASHVHSKLRLVS